MRERRGLWKADIRGRGLDEGCGVHEAEKNREGIWKELISLSIPVRLQRGVGVTEVACRQRRVSTSQ